MAILPSDGIGSIDCGLSDLSLDNNKVGPDHFGRLARVEDIYGNDPIYRLVSRAVWLSSHDGCALERRLHIGASRKPDQRTRTAH